MRIHQKFERNYQSGIRYKQPRGKQELTKSDKEARKIVLPKDIHGGCASLSTLRDDLDGLKQ